jgi:hypothetical protein
MNAEYGHPVLKSRVSANTPGSKYNKAISSGKHANTAMAATRLAAKMPNKIAMRR